MHSRKEPGWSMSRYKLLKECARKYFYNYYASKGGYNPEARELARKAYMLKKLDNRWTWSGKIVHEALKIFFTRLKQGARLPVCEEVIAYFTDEMRKQFIHSRSHAYRNNPGSFGLVEHELGLPVSNEEWAGVAKSTFESLRCFFKSPYISEIRELSQEAVIKVEVLESMDMENGDFLYAKKDLEFKDANGRIVTVDWKTGRQESSHARQMVVYGMHSAQINGVGLDEVAAYALYLGNCAEGEDPDVLEVIPSQSAVKVLNEIISDQLSEMRSYLNDDGSLPKPMEAFEAKTGGLCPFCSFLPLCMEGKEAVQSRLVLT
jgi:hypothetical protein